VRDEVTAVCNGLLGDVLEERRSGLAIPMSLRAEADRGAGPSVCVFVPGLMSTDGVWRFPGAPDDTYGSRLAADRDVSPVFVRYNSGRHISTNGRELAGLLDELVTTWPVPVEELTLVGHSLGGLVIRSACYYGGLERHDWVGTVRRVFLLGAPLAGVPLEKLVHLAACTLTTIWNPVTRIIGRALNRRSAGIKDLRYGLLLDEDWSGRDPDAPRWPRRQGVPLPDAMPHYVITGSLLEDAEAMVAQLLGDPLVTALSAKGRTLTAGAAPAFPVSQVRILPKVNHVALAHHHQVYDQILAWWGGEPGSGSGATTWPPAPADADPQGP
jgi:triacylglycerol lipase